jgi:hypothetical protein
LPLLWRDRVLGWANVAAAGGAISPEIHYVAGRPPRDRGFATALDGELSRLAASLGLSAGQRARRG